MTARVPIACAAALLMLAMPLVVSAESPATGEYALDTKTSKVAFTVSAHVLFTIKKEGKFNEFAGVVSYNPDRPRDTRMDLTVYTASVDTKSTENDQLLRSTDFFDVDHYPTMHFASTNVSVLPDGGLNVTGDLTIRGITKRLVLPIRTIAGRRGSDLLAALETHFQIDRRDFGLVGGPSSAGLRVSIGKKVDIHLVLATGPASSAR